MWLHVCVHKPSHLLKSASRLNPGLQLHCTCPFTLLQIWEHPPLCSLQGSFTENHSTHTHTHTDKCSHNHHNITTVNTQVKDGVYMWTHIRSVFRLFWAGSCCDIHTCTGRFPNRHTCVHSRHSLRSKSWPLEKSHKQTDTQCFLNAPLLTLLQPFGKVNPDIWLPDRL